MGDHDDDLMLGPDTWLPLQSKDIENTSPLSIDQWLEPTWPFWQAFETECVAACCGIHAFSFWPENVRNAATACGLPGLSAAFDELCRSIEIESADSLISSRLNQLIYKGPLLALLRHIVTHLPQTSFESPSE